MGITCLDGIPLMCVDVMKQTGMDWDEFDEVPQDIILGTRLNF